MNTKDTSVISAAQARLAYWTGIHRKAEVARHLGISRQLLRYWLAGHTRPAVAERILSAPEMEARRE